MIWNRINLVKCHFYQFSYRRYNGHFSQCSYYFKPGDVSLRSSTMSQILDESETKCGDQVAFLSAHQGILKTISNFRQEVHKLASGFISCGLKKGDRIAICVPNCYEWPMVQFAAAKAGLVLVTVNPAYQANELGYCLKKVDCKALVISDFLKTQNFHDMLCGLIPDLPQKDPYKLKCSNFPSLEKIIMISKQPKSGVLNFSEIFESGNVESDKELAKIEKLIQFDDPVNIQFTSGTTGNPKGSVLSHHNIVNNCLLTGRRFQFDILRPTICCQVPLFHCFGCVLGTVGTIMFGGSLVFPSPSYNISSSFKAIEQFKCTTVFGTPTMYVDMLHEFRLHKYNVESLKQAVLGGAPANETLLTNIRNELGISYINIAYGSTENSPVVAVTGNNDDFENVKNSLLQSLEYVEIKNIDDNGHIVPINTQGELCVRGHNVFIGYWDEPEKTAETVDKNNWYHTGDLCMMNEAGLIKIMGRKKDMILRGGENIYPLEIENFLTTHPAVLETHVVGVPDERMGEQICAWIAVKKGMAVTEQEIKAFCKGKISHFKIPHYILFVEEFPKTQSGKIKKFEMQRISIERLDL